MIATYPQATGWKTEDPPTSRLAGLAEEGRAATLRDEARTLLAYQDLTADECAALMESTVLAVRPRLSELRAQGRIEPTGERRRNASGHSAAVWRAVRVQRQEEFAL